MEKGLGDKAMIRHEFPDVVLFEQLMATTTAVTTATGRGRVMADPEDENLLMFTLMAASSGFVSVQGSVTVASSYFGGSVVVVVVVRHRHPGGLNDSAFAPPPLTPLE
jgi:hypothetical protein